MGDDGNAVAQQVSLIHVMSGQQDGPPCPVAQNIRRGSGATPRLLQPMLALLR